MPRSKNPNPSQVSSSLPDSPPPGNEEDNGENGAPPGSFSPPEINGSDTELDRFSSKSAEPAALASHSVSSAPCPDDVDELDSRAQANKDKISGNRCSRATSASNGDASSRDDNNNSNGSLTVAVYGEAESATDLAEPNENYPPDIESTAALPHDSSRPTLITYPMPGYKKTEVGSKVRASYYAPSIPSLINWFRRRFALKDGAYTSASQVIKLYDEDFDGKGFVSLHNFQVGQYLRRLFPGLQRRKITKNGKRSWVYRDLCVVNDASAVELDVVPPAAGNEGSTEVDVRRSGRLRRVKSFDQDYDCSSENKTEKRIMKRKLQSDGILYKLLYPPAFTNSSGAHGKAALNARAKSTREENILQWLRENYEYADNSFVRSLDVLRRYNNGRNSWVQHLSQVGRFIKYVFPRVKHSRRTLKGGKREWVYQNIRPKADKPRTPVISHSSDTRESDDVQESNKAPTARANSAFVELARDETNNTEGDSDSSLCKIDLSIAALPTLPAELARIYQRESSSTLASDLKRRKTSNSNGGKPPSESLIYRRAQRAANANDKVYCAKSGLLSSVPARRSFLESHIDRLRESKGDLARGGGATPRTFRLRSAKEADGADPADAEAGVLLTLAALCAAEDDDHDRIGKFGYFKSGLQLSAKSWESGSSSADTAIRKTDAKPNLEDLMDNVKREVENQGSGAPSRHDGSEIIEWNELKDCFTHRSGWMATPTAQAIGKSNCVEWVFFDGDALCNGHRVLRELRIYDDWSVSIHVMGGKVHPEEIGGITDMGRTRADVRKLFDTLADAKVCRGFASPCLSDIRTRGVVVAKSEIWSVRNEENEELRHRAINCQILHRRDDESCCEKCMRIMLMQKQISDSTSRDDRSSKDTSK